MTTMRGVNPLVTKGWCILLGLWDLQWVWNLVHVTFLTPITFRRLQIFFLFLKLGLTHPASYLHINTAKQMIQSLKQFCIEGCRWVLCWHSKQENTSGNDKFQLSKSTVRTSNKQAQILLHCSFTKTWQNFNMVSQRSITYSEPVCSRIYTACQAHVLYHIIIRGLSDSTFSHTVSQNTTIFRNT